jgi:chromosome segregation ATPase
MTSLQINRNNWLEAKRHNASVEAESLRHNQEQERLSREANEESARSNRAREALTAQQNATAVYEAETKRAQQQEQARNNLATMAETIRHNTKTETATRALARMENSREWAKLSLQEQRNSVQNSLDETKVQAQKLQNDITAYQNSLGKPSMEVQKLAEEIGKIRNDVDVANRTLNQRIRVDEAAMSVNERNAKTNEFKALAGTATTIGKQVTDVATALLKLFLK